MVTGIREMMSHNLADEAGKSDRTSRWVYLRASDSEARQSVQTR